MPKGLVEAAAKAGDSESPTFSKKYVLPSAAPMKRSKCPSRSMSTGVGVEPLPTFVRPNGLKADPWLKSGDVGVPRFCTNRVLPSFPGWMRFAGRGFEGIT